MDIKYVADKALADTESGKKDKKEKKEEDKTATNDLWQAVSCAL